MGRFSEKLMDHFQYPSNRHEMLEPDAVGHADLAGGAPFVTIYLRLDGQTVVGATFEAAGCGVTIACASMLTEMVVGQPIADCEALSVADLQHALDGIPPDKTYCPAVVIEALRDGIRHLGPNAGQSRNGNME